MTLISEICHEGLGFREGRARAGGVVRAVGAVIVLEGASVGTLLKGCSGESEGGALQYNLVLQSNRHILTLNSFLCDSRHVTP